MSIVEKILLIVFVLGVTIFFIGAGAALTWMVIEDTALGRAIDEAMNDRIERWKNGKID